MVAEGAELIGPESLDVLKPAVQLIEGLAAKMVHPNAAIAWVLVLLFDKPVSAEGSQMAAHQGGADADDLRQLTGAMGAIAEQIDDAAAGGLGQSGEGAVEGGHLAAGMGVAKIHR